VPVPLSDLAPISDEVARNYPGASIEPIEVAAGMVADEDRQRALARAVTVAGLHLDPDAVAASLLAPTKHGFDLGALSEEIGELVVAVTRLSTIRWNAIGDESSENLRRMFVAMAADVRVVLIAIADRVQTMRSLDRGSETAHAIATETLEVFAPLANRLGVWQLKWELEDLSLRELEPTVYSELTRLLAETRTRRDEYVAEMMRTLGALLDEHGIEGSITGRPKHIYSIFKKMRRKQVGFDQIYDVTAVRIIVSEIKDCYAALGLVHGEWAPIPGEFDDYVARPKDNGYQSLHTAVVGPEGRSVEIQIRTREMHEFGEFGVAAHWAYKEGSKASRDADRRFNVLRQLMDWHKDLEDPEAFAETLKTDLFEDQVYVFTPNGDVLALPRGATPVDFAYRVHTMVGHRCRGARVNGQIVPLHTPLQTGDRVEVLTRKEPQPSRDWINPHAGFLKSSGARQKVRQWFRQQGRDDAIDAGRDLLERECKRLGLREIDTAPLLDAHRLRGTDDLYAAVGFGDLGAHSLAATLYDAQRPEPEPVPPPPKRAPKRRRSTLGVSAGGVESVMGQPARCCSPVPGDPVIGFISRGRGLVIHRRDCPNVRNTPEPERLMDVDWGASDRARYPVRIAIHVRDQPGALRDVAAAFSEMGVNLLEASSSARNDGTATIWVRVEIRRAADLQLVLSRLQRLRVVHDAHRVDD
jgi:GTP pyrophosphokinase